MLRGPLRSTLTATFLPYMTFFGTEGGAGGEGAVEVVERQRHIHCAQVHVGVAGPATSKRSGPQRERAELGLHRQRAGCDLPRPAEHGQGRVERDNRLTERGGVPTRPAAEVDGYPFRTTSPERLRLGQPTRAPAALVAVALGLVDVDRLPVGRSEEHTSELQSLMRISYAVFCLKKKKQKNNNMTMH